MNIWIRIREMIEKKEEDYLCWAILNINCSEAEKINAGFFLEKHSNYLIKNLDNISKLIYPHWPNNERGRLARIAFCNRMLRITMLKWVVMGKYTINGACAIIGDTQLRNWVQKWYKGSICHDWMNQYKACQERLKLYQDRNQA